MDKKLDVKFKEYQASIIEAVDFKFQVLERRVDVFEEKLDRLMNTLDRFLKRLADHEEEFKIMKAEVDKMKSVIKEKLGVEISIF